MLPMNFLFRGLDKWALHFPNEEDLSTRFEPGVRFYFEYERLSKHPNAVCDGVLPMKVKDEIVLKD